MKNYSYEKKVTHPGEHKKHAGGSMKQITHPNQHLLLSNFKNMWRSKFNYYTLVTEL